MLYVYYWIGLLLLISYCQRYVYAFTTVILLHSTSLISLLPCDIQIVLEGAMVAEW